ncbi:18932_t:CDS:1, partial [Funneliformis geosporum]
CEVVDSASSLHLLLLETKLLKPILVFATDFMGFDILNLELKEL